MPLPAETFKVFISHATQPDSRLANWIADALDRLHIRAFVYERYQMGGQNRFETIKALIDLCPYFLVLLTADGIASQWVNQEIGYAVAKGKSPIPIIEVNPLTGRYLDSKGFVELHDPILYNPNNLTDLMARIVYTFRGTLPSVGVWRWRDLIYLSCECGFDFDGKLEFDKWWVKFTNNRTITSFPIAWQCKSCNKQVALSFPDCHLIH